MPGAPLSAPKRVLIKLSGEALGSDTASLNIAEIDRFAEEIKSAQKRGLQIAVVVGGGNILRGSKQEKEGADRVTADHMGMLATAINGLAIKERLIKNGVPSALMSSFSIESVLERFQRDLALRYLENGEVVVFVGGTGNPFFSTDSAAALRAAEIKAEMLLKATKVDGVYDKDPNEHSDAKRYSDISYREVIRGELKVMDATAIALCEENDIPLKVFNFTEKGVLKKILAGENLGTIIGGKSNA